MGVEEIYAPKSREVPLVLMLLDDSGERHHWPRLEVLVPGLKGSLQYLDSS